MGRKCHRCNSSYAGDGERCRYCNTYLGPLSNMIEMRDSRASDSGSSRTCIRCRSSIVFGTLCDKCRVDVKPTRQNRAWWDDD